MASKSRLGKGLGALFPTLPGEEPVAEQPAMIAEDSSTPEATADITPAKKATAQQESKTCRASDDIVQQGSQESRR